MQVISEVGPCVGRDVSFSRNFEKVHVLKGSEYLVGAKLLPSAVDLLRKVLFGLSDGIFSPEALLQVLKSAEALYVLGGRLAVFVAVTLLNILDGLLVY